MNILFNFKSAIILLVGILVSITSYTQQNDKAPMIVEDQGNFMVGGSVLQNENGQTFHGDNA